MFEWLYDTKRLQNENSFCDKIGEAVRELARPLTP